MRVGRVLTRGRCSSEIWRLKLNPGRNLKDLKMSWSRLSRKGSAPVERNSFACTVHKRRMLFFGGCDDNDLQEDIMNFGTRNFKKKLSVKGEESPNEYLDLTDIKDLSE